jgi:pyridoxamine 5'-phosphate oxidase
MSKKAQIPPSPSDDEYKNHPASDIATIEQIENPLVIFADWFVQARKKEPNDANALALASVDESGMPDVRMVLLKDFDENGFVFYTNFNSAKGQQLLQNPKAAMVFHWKSLRRQIRIRGEVEQVSAREADEYFASRARQSQIGAWASNQSETMENLGELVKNVADFGLKFGLGKVARPPHWSGFRLIPTRIEFWRDRAFRLHERLEYSRENATAEWQIRRQFP